MLKVGDRVKHDLYGLGEIVTSPDESGIVDVAFENEFEIVVGKVIDTDHYFEDDKRLEKTNFIEVRTAELKKFRPKDRTPNCHTCRKLISSRTHQICENCIGLFKKTWLKCNCGSCGCNYVPKHPL